MAGSKLVNINGYKVAIHPDQAKELRRLASDALGRIFREALEHGQSLVTLGGYSYVLKRLPDHSFELVRYSDEHRTPM